MKKIKYIIGIAAFSLLAVSCNDSFMDRTPLTEIDDAKYWSTTNDLKLYINNLYDRNDLLAREDGWGSIGPYGWDGDDGSDTQVRYQYNTRMNGEQTIPSDDAGWAYGDWEALRSINYFMDRYPLVEELVASDVEKMKELRQYVGEALFFRSIFYFNKLRRYGDLPWASTLVTQTSEDLLYQERLPRNQIVDSIMLDLDRAVEYLPSQSSPGWTGRINKQVAMALQARIALYEGTWEKYHANDDFKAAVNQSTRFLEKAAQVSGELITMSETSGYPALDNVGVENGYRDLFNQEDYSTSSEVIFWRKYQAGVINSIWDRYSANGAGRGATKSLVDSYLRMDGTPVPANYDDATLVSITQNRDPRLEQTIQINDRKHLRWEKANPPIYFIAPAFDGWDSEESCPTGYQTYKGHNFRYAEARPAGLGLQALIYFRFGETLLIYAEAKAELGTITQDDLDRSINKLRDRVGMPHMTMGVANDPNFEFASLNPVIQEIRRERKVELACEGFRRDDIFRWAAADELIVGKIPVGAKIAQFQTFKFEDYLPEAAPDLSRQEKFDERVAALEADANGYVKIFKSTLNGGTEGFKFKVNRDYLLPIPPDQLTINPKMKQNPGWN